MNTIESLMDEYAAAFKSHSEQAQQHKQHAAQHEAECLKLAGAIAALKEVQRREESRQSPKMPLETPESNESIECIP